MTPAERLDRGLGELTLELSADTRQRLLDYLGLIRKWNQVYNLTAVRDLDRMVSHHLLDSLAVVPHISGPRILDVGSGAGLPGVVLALVLREAHVTLLDANQKKAAFLRQATIELGLANTTIVCGRIEAWRTEQAFDVVIARAFSDLATFCEAAGRLCAEGGSLFAMKGAYPHAELERVPAPCRLRNVVTLKIPGMRAPRHLVRIETT